MRAARALALHVSCGWARVIAICLLMPLAAPRAPALAAVQSPQQPGFQISVNVNLVTVDATVADARGAFVAGLKRENFCVLVDGVPQTITHFEAFEAPVQVLLFVETSPAVFFIRHDHLLAASALLDGLAPEDRVAVAAYDQSARILLGFTADKSAAALALNRMAAGYGVGMAKLNLSESLAATLDQLRTLPGKKAIVLLATGLDTSPSGSSAILEQRLAASDVVIFPVALGAALRGSDSKKKPRNAPTENSAESSFQEADRALRGLAEMSGGHAYFPRGPAEFAAIYRQVAGLIRHQYSLGFEPAVHDGMFHRIEVQVLDSAGRSRVKGDGSPFYSISHRKGYLAPRD